LDDFQFLRHHTGRPIKVTLPGPYLLTRAMWVPEATRKVYETKEDLAEDVVAILRDEAAAVQAAGARFIQFDEPVLTELVFTQGRPRTFMCAALAARKDPAEELEFAVSLLNRVVAPLDRAISGVHVCRGNWSTDEQTLLTGSYHPLVPYFARMHVDQLVLEYATPRAGEIVEVGDKSLGLGVVNPRTTEVESSQAIAERVRAASRRVPAARIFLNPDCGFGTFAARAVNTADVAARKLSVMVDAARALRAEAAVPRSNGEGETDPNAGFVTPSETSDRRD
jgi:5-methyltetrahydropteroyltriglutamate--homocysteine methyltransferase